MIEVARSPALFAPTNTLPGGVRRLSRDRTRCNAPHTSTRSHPRARRTPEDSLAHIPSVEDPCTERAELRRGRHRARFSMRRRVLRAKQPRGSTQRAWAFARAKIDAEGVAVSSRAECSGPRRSTLVLSRERIRRNFNGIACLSSIFRRDLVHNGLRRFPVVILQHSAETLLALDRVALGRRR